MPFRLLLPGNLYEEMVAQAREEFPNECCGLLAGRFCEFGETGLRVGQVLGRFPLVNAAASPREFLSQPESMFTAIRHISQEGWEILAVYHSHPDSDAIPSARDREMNFGPEVMNLIISLKTPVPVVRGWWIGNGVQREADWRQFEEKAGYPIEANS